MTYWREEGRRICGSSFRGEPDFGPHEASPRLVPTPSACDVARACPDCGRPGALRPHVVWVGEMPLAMDLIDRALRKADLFVAIGTSGAVYPAAGFVAAARAYGILTCEINLEAADNADLFDQQRLGAASETVPAWVEELLRG